MRSSCISLTLNACFSGTLVQSGWFFAGTKLLFARWFHFFRSHTFPGALLLLFPPHGLLNRNSVVIILDLPGFLSSLFFFQLQMPGLA